MALSKPSQVEVKTSLSSLRLRQVGSGAGQTTRRWIDKTAPIVAFRRWDGKIVHQPVLSYFGRSAPSGLTQVDRIPPISVTRI